MNDLNRRDFQRYGIGALITWSLLDTLFSRDAFAQQVKPLAAKWLAELNSLSLDLKGKKLDQMVETARWRTDW